MPITLGELLPSLYKLSRAEKYRALQFLIADLAREDLVENREETGWFPTEEPCPLWTPQESFESARSLLRSLKEEAMKVTEEA